MATRFILAICQLDSLSRKLSICVTHALACSLYFLSSFLMGMNFFFQEGRKKFLSLTRGFSRAPKIYLAGSFTFLICGCSSQVDEEVSKRLHPVTCFPIHSTELRTRQIRRGARITWMSRFSPVLLKKTDSFRAKVKLKNYLTKPMRRLFKAIYIIVGAS